jgi:hypothetical protein
MRAPQFALSALLISAFAPAAWAGDQDFTLMNNSGRQVDSVYVSKHSTTDWEEDIMGRDTLSSGESVNISFSKGERGCQYDMMVKYHAGGQDAWPNLNLCEISKITLSRDEQGEVQAHSE